MSAWTTFGVGQIIKITVLGRTADRKIYATLMEWGRGSRPCSIFLLPCGWGGGGRSRLREVCRCSSVGSPPPVRARAAVLPEKSNPPVEARPSCQWITVHRSAGSPGKDNQAHRSSKPSVLRYIIGHQIKGGAADNDKYGFAYLLFLVVYCHSDPRDIWRKPDPPRAESLGKPGRFETAVLYFWV